MIPKVQAVRRDQSSLTVQVIYTDQTIETYMDGFSRLFEIKIGLTKSQVHQIVNLSKTTIKTGAASNSTASSSADTSAAGNSSSKTSGGNVFVRAHLDPQTFDPLRARVEAAGAYMNSPWATVTVPDLSAQAKSKAASRSLASDTLGSAQAHTSAPWDDPLSAQTNDNIVACIDAPEWRPDVNPNYILPNQIYYHDKFPSINLHSIISGAIEVLNKHKNLHVTKIDLHTNSVDGEVSLVFSADDRKPGFRKTLEVTFPHKAFERFTHDLDRYAGLKAKWDTNTYIKMRIAYLLLHALRLKKEDAEKINLDVIRIFASNTRPTFTI